MSAKSSQSSRSSQGSGRARLKIPVVYDNDKAGFIFTPSRLNPWLLRLLWLLAQTVTAARSIP